ncbi:MAG: squalene/phytoene synthase family protein [Alphaproteobacteria bacterium]|nr:squalene/phytoene synthase family protein [Alphaproteobacteria bacterium]
MASDDPQTGPALSHCGRLTHDRDYDRFLTALTAPPDRREALFALYAFNFEVAKVSDVVSESLLGAIRFLWWREALEECAAGTPRRHAVVLALAPEIAEGRIPKPQLDRIIDARESDLEHRPPADMAAMERYARETGGALTLAALGAVGAAEEGAAQALLNRIAEDVGAAWALVGLMRAMPHQLRARRRMLPDTLLAEFGVAESDLLELRPVPGLSSCVASVCAHAETLLNTAREDARTLPNPLIKNAFPALSSGVLARAYLTRLRRAGFDPLNQAAARPPVGRGLRLLAARWRGSL